MTDTGVEWITRHLKTNTGLLHLDLSGLVCTVVSRSCVFTLECFCTSNKVSRDGAGFIAELLYVNTCLKSIDISCNRIENEGLIAISEALRHANTTLER